MAHAVIGYCKRLYLISDQVFEVMVNYSFEEYLKNGQCQNAKREQNVFTEGLGEKRMQMISYTQIFVFKSRELSYRM